MKSMWFIEQIFKTNNIDSTLLLRILIISLIMGLYESASYVLISKKSMNNKSVIISIVLIPSFISTIILCLQQNTVITLGTIGALAIIRFRNAIKEPIDMIYLLWSIHSGIMVGCQLYLVSFFTSVMVTLVLLGFELIRIQSNHYLLIIKTTESVSDDFFKKLLNNVVLKYKIEDRNYSNNSHDYILNIKTKDILLLENTLISNERIKSYSLLESQNGE